MNQRQMRQAMQRMGIKQIEVEAQAVIIKTADKDIIIENPSVAKVNMMGQETWQITGKAIEQPTSSQPTISEEDIKTVATQANVDQEKAEKALVEADGDIAAAIMQLQE